MTLEKASSIADYLINHCGYTEDDVGMFGRTTAAIIAPPEATRDCKELSEYSRDSMGKYCLVWY